MSEKMFKMYRRAGKDIATQTTVYNIKLYLERLCKSPLKTRIAFTWKILQGRNPHTGEKMR